MIRPAMIPSPQCYALLKQFEGCRLTAYRDSAGIPTIGYGHTHGVVMGMTCTQEEAEAWLAVDATVAESCINIPVDVPLTQNQFDALVCFVYNVGCSAFHGSTMLRYINAGAFQLAAAEFPKWDHAGGVEVEGLRKRRLAEQALFLLPAATGAPNAAQVT